MHTVRHAWAVPAEEDLVGAVARWILVRIEENDVMSGASQQQGGEEADRTPADNRDISHVNPPLPAPPEPSTGGDTAKPGR
jgi:hypothetical protein